MESRSITPLPHSFYARSVLAVARDVIGKTLVRNHPLGELRARIVEAEAYRGPEDRAAHSYGGRRTERTEAMFGPAGHAYIFLLYGMHWHLNLVTGEYDAPQAVLIRAVEPLIGIEKMAALRGVDAHDAQGRAHSTLTNGPGKLCQALGIDSSLYAHDLTRSPLLLTDGPKLARGQLGRSERIGIDYAGSWARKPWRFYERENRFVSGPRRLRS